MRLLAAPSATRVTATCRPFSRAASMSICLKDGVAAGAEGGIWNWQEYLIFLIFCCISGYFLLVYLGMYVSVLKLFLIFCKKVLTGDVFCVTFIVRRGGAFLK